MKTCTQCGLKKHYTEFYLRSSTGKRFSSCKSCNVEKVRAWQKKNPGKVNEYVKRHREKHGPDYRQPYAYQEAMRKLRGMYRADFEVLYQKERKAVGLP